jgi:DMSO/TMAO reductase YedYZ heme-binding membrane subunit
VTGLYLLLAVEVSSLARKRLPNRIWRRLHFLAFPLYLVATLHMLTAGTDGTTAVALLAVTASGVAIGALVAVRSGKMAGVVAPGPQPSRSNRQKAGALR